MSSSPILPGVKCFDFISAASERKGVHQFRAAAVVQGQGKRSAGVARRGLLGPAHLVLDLCGQFVGAPDVFHAHVVVHHALEIGF